MIFDVYTLVRSRLSLPEGFMPAVLSCAHCPDSVLSLDTPPRMHLRPSAWGGAKVLDEGATDREHLKMFADWFDTHKDCAERAETRRKHPGGWRDE